MQNMPIVAQYGRHGPLPTRQFEVKPAFFLAG
jgi:hypothetical protein